MENTVNEKKRMILKVVTLNSRSLAVRERSEKEKRDKGRIQKEETRDKQQLALIFTK